MLMPNTQQLPTTSEAHAEPSAIPSTSKVERRQHTAATSARSRMSIICMDDDASVVRPASSSRRRPTVKKYSLDDFNFVKVLGKGSFGKVRLGHFLGHSDWRYQCIFQKCNSVKNIFLYLKVFPLFHLTRSNRRLRRLYPLF